MYDRRCAHALHSPTVTEHSCSIKSKSVLSERVKLGEWVRNDDSAVHFAGYMQVFQEALLKTYCI